ncbi:MAG: M14 family zinc carboxypeptidase [Gammaproteobacteria bacterium]
MPRPESVLGHEIGARYARHDLVVQWFEALAEVSPRVRLIDVGRTHEGRRQVTAVISSITNLDNLQEVQRAHLAGEPGAPIFTWHGYSIHGNEASGVQAAMAVAWYLAASRDPDIRAMLRNTVIMIDPALNPDGYGRFSTWANHASGRVPVGDARHRERVEPWPGGRTNHYFFDLNRDWLLLQQPETVNRVRLLQQYRPHVMTDHHEMSGDSTFFFQPGVETRWHPMIPEANRALTEALAAYPAEALDGAQRLYFSGENYDDFYPGKGSTWPDLQGTVGILFEQASTGGLVRDTRQGTITLPRAVHNHVLATLATLTGMGPAVRLRRVGEPAVPGAFEARYGKPRQSQLCGHRPDGTGGLGAAMGRLLCARRARASAGSRGAGQGRPHSVRVAQQRAAGQLQARGHCHPPE